MRVRNIEYANKDGRIILESFLPHNDIGNRYEHRFQELMNNPDIVKVVKSNGEV